MLKDNNPEKSIKNVGMTDRDAPKARPNEIKTGNLQKRPGGEVIERQSTPEKEVVRIRTGVDRMFLITVLLLVCFGSVMVFSAGYVYSGTEYGDNFYLIKRQLGFVFIGTLAMLFAMRMNYNVYKVGARAAYAAAIVLLLLVIAIGSVGGGAQRWLVIPGIGISFQPSEIAKLAIVLMLAWYMSAYSEKITDYGNFKKSFLYGIVFPFALLGAICVLVVLEKHFSGLVIIAVIGIVVMFVGGSRFRWLALIGVAAAVVVVVLILSTGYSLDRVTSWLDPEANYLDGGWQTVNGMNAIGSGGLFGVGLGNSRLKYGYVSMPHNDFIFTIVCEELGYVGALAVIALFAILIWRGFVIAMKAPDIFSSLTVIGIISKVAIQMILNIAVVTNLIPNTGISLPFFSYGGTALLILMFEMGIVLSISKHSYQKK